MSISSTLLVSKGLKSTHVNQALPSLRWKSVLTVLRHVYLIHWLRISQYTRHYLVYDVNMLNSEIRRRLVDQIYDFH